MTFFKNKAKHANDTLNKHVEKLDIFIALILALMTVLSLYEPIRSALSVLSNTAFVSALKPTLKLFILPFFYDVRHIAFTISALLAITVGCLYIAKFKLHLLQYPSEQDYLKEKTKNRINQNVFNSLYQINASKVKQIIRSTYKGVAQWNPTDYTKNIIAYDVHEHIRCILIKISELVISIDPARFNEQNVSVGLLYNYPEYTEPNDISLPCSKVYLSNDSSQDEDKKQSIWKFISSGDASGNHYSVLNHLSSENSFFTLVDALGTVFRNNKFDRLESYQLESVSKHLKKEIRRNTSFFIEDVRDTERITSNGIPEGSAIGTVIIVRNNAPTEIFVKAILTINTYGSMLYDKQTYHGKSDSLGFTVEDYELVFRNIILKTYSKLLEAELAQMYIRHTLLHGDRCPKTGQKVNKSSTNSSPNCSNCSTSNCKNYPSNSNQSNSSATTNPSSTTPNSQTP